MSSTLANRMRPQNLKDIIGQQHLVGPNAILTKFVQKSHPFSIILYGSPGCGKTTIAMALANDLDIPYRMFIDLIKRAKMIFFHTWKVDY